MNTVSPDDPPSFLDMNLDEYEPHVKFEPSDDTGWTRIAPHYDPGTLDTDYWIEVARRVDSGYVKYDDTKSGSAFVALPLGYELYSYRYEELSANGKVTYSVTPSPPDSVKVVYEVTSEGSFIDRKRGWLSLKVFARGRRIPE